MQAKTHETILTTIIITSILVCIISSFVIFRMYNTFHGAVSQEKHNQVINLMQADPELKPIIEDAMKDDKITGQEYDAIMKVSNSRKMRILFNR